MPWSVPVDLIGRSLVIGDNADLYVLNDDSGELDAYRHDSGAQKWSIPLTSSIGTHLGQVGQYLCLYFLGSGGSILDPDTGSIVKDFPQGQISLGYQVIYVVDSVSHQLTAYDGADGLKELWTLPLQSSASVLVCYSHLVLAQNGQLLILG